MTAFAENLAPRLSLARLRADGRERARDLAHTALVACDQAVVSLSSFAATVIVGRVCGREELGIYVLATTTFWLLAGIPNALTWTPFTSRAPRMSPDRRAAYCGSITAHTALITAAIAAIFAVAGLLPASNMGASGWFGPMCLALVPFTALMMLREHVRRLCMSEVAAVDLLVLDVPIAIVQLALLSALAYYGKLTSTTALLAVAGSCSIAAVWLVAHRSDLKLVPRLARFHWRYNLQFGRWLFGLSIAWLLGDSMYRWIVGWQFGLDGLGRFASALAVVLFINPLLLTATNFGRALSANQLASGGIDQLRRLTIQATLFLAVVGGAAFLALAIIGGPAVRLIFGQQYSGLGGIVATLCLAMFVRIAGVPIDASLAALRLGRQMFVSVAAQLAVIVFIGIPLISIGGLAAVGYTMALAYAATAAIQWLAFVRHTHRVAPTTDTLAPPQSAPGSAGGSATFSEPALV